MRQSFESEQIVLGGVMQDRRILDEIHVEPHHFHDPKHESLFHLIRDEARQGNSVDLAAMGQRIVSAPIPGVDAAYLHVLYRSPAIPWDAVYHSKIVSSLFTLRAISVTAARIQQRSEDADWEDSDAVLQDARRDLDEAQSTISGGGVRTFADALEDAILAWQAPTPPGTPTGWADLDHMLNGGWRPGQLTILGARPAVGKSMIAGAAAVQAHASGVGFFSLEMSELELVGRLSANRAGIDLSRIEKHEMTDLDWQKIVRLQSDPLQGLVMHVGHRIPATMIRRKIRDWSRRQDVSLVVVDYLQLMKPADSSESRERQVSRLAEDLKVIAQEFNTHVLALAQVNRGAAERPPMMSDLRESGGIEAHADNVILLHQEDKLMGEIELKVVKNRHGRTDDVKLSWQPHYGAAKDLWKGTA